MGFARMVSHPWLGRGYK